jgi:uncharacterized protein YecT (DUF1311 family)
MKLHNKSVCSIFSTALFCVAVLMQSTKAAPSERECPIPKGWRTELDPESLGPILKGAFETPSGVIPQQGLNQYLSIMASQWDAKLMETYLTLSSRLNAEEKRNLLTQQTAWLTKRDKESTKAEKSEDRGTLGPTAYSEAFIRMTKARDAELLKRLSETKKCSHQGH